MGRAESVDERLAAAWVEQAESPSAGSRVHRAVAIATAALILVAAPFAVAGPSANPGSVDARASRTGDVLREGVRNPARGAAGRETQLVSGVTGNRFGTRQSNLSRGADAGGAAVYGCRRPSRECTRHVNLAGGPAAHFAVQGPGAVPFTLDSNATGLVEGLNAERVGGLTASELRGREGPRGPSGPAGPSGPPGPPGPPLTLGIELVEATSAFNKTSLKFADAPCPQGKSLVGGGGLVSVQNDTVASGPSLEVAIVRSAPQSLANPNVWRVTADYMGGPGDALLDWRVIARAICVG